MRCARRLSKLRFSSLSGWNRRRGKKNMRAARPRTLRQVRITCTTAKQGCRIFLISWCWCFASAAFQLRKLVVHSTKFPAGAVQPAQWRELDLSSSRATAESPVVMRCARRLSKLRFSSLSGETADGGKEHEGCAPSYSAAGESHLHPGKPSLPYFIKIVWCWCFASAAFQQRRLVPHGPSRAIRIFRDFLIRLWKKGGMNVYYFLLKSKLASL